jgi:hypothetical protein
VANKEKEGRKEKRKGKGRKERKGRKRKGGRKRKEGKEGRKRNEGRKERKGRKEKGVRKPPCRFEVFQPRGRHGSDLTFVIQMQTVRSRAGSRGERPDTVYSKKEFSKKYQYN